MQKRTPTQLDRKTRERRKDEILDSALNILKRQGYKKTTMLAVAREASASKETLYSWFGDKQGLVTALIHRNAASVQEKLETSLSSNLPPVEELTRFGNELLTLLLGDSAVALNRAAISEAATDPTFGHLIVSAGRNSTLPTLISYLEKQKKLGRLKFEDASDAAKTLVGLLIGDNQTMRLLGVSAKPDETWITERSYQSSVKFMDLFGAD